jgi:two-component system CAI-1 autoinducer sensor kinase/phosphatase CqsS
MEVIDLISTSSSRSLEIIDIIKRKEINKKRFVHILISTIIEAAIREYAFKNDEEKKLVSVDLKNDFDFYGNETLMIFAVQKLLKNSFKTKANKIHIWLDGHNRCLYFMDNRAAQRLINLSFLKKTMKTFGGNVSYELSEERGVQFCFKF